MNSISFVFIVLLHLSSQAAVKDPVYDEVDGLALVEALYKNGQFQAAEVELERLEKNLNSTEHSLWRARLRLAQEDAHGVLKILESEPSVGEVALMQARAHQRLNNCPASASAYARTQGLWQHADSDVTTYSRCVSPQEAYALLNEVKRNSVTLLLERVNTGLRLGLVRQGLDLIKTQVTNLTSSELLSLAEVFYSSGHHDAAEVVMEYARMHSPRSVEVNLSFAQLYFSQGRRTPTLDAFERAARADAKYAYHVTELSRQNLQFERASYWNHWIQDSEQSLRARLALYVDQNRFPLIASTHQLVALTDLKANDEITYALSYSQARFGEVDRPLKALARIRQPELLEKAGRLRQALLSCRETPESCRL